MGYCINVHQIFTRCSGIIAGVNAHMQMVILHSFQNASAKTGGGQIRRLQKKIKMRGKA